MPGVRSRADDGFTLVELLVVMIVVGILAAIAVPVFIAQKSKAADAAVKTDLRTIAQSEETYFTDYERYLAVSTTSSPTIIDPIRLSPDVSVQVKLNAAGSSYCIIGSSTRTSNVWVHVSDAGGQQSKGVTACPSGF
ncbi:prepilin-type N-terminal cleavage/methylation domain-containing protein [Kineococcus sp. NPDC059986]|uniref:type IV pilin protein n=1 Tax=Kineococcus sp. NPDC059986 TaxID=3155538 RepID=UPI00344C2F2E